MRRAARALTRTATLVVLMAVACDRQQEVAIDIRVFPARHDPAPQEPAPAGWRRVEFGGSTRSRAGTYLVSDQALLSGWNLTAFRSAADADGSRSITFRLNAAGRRKLERFCADPANLKTPLALWVDGRWADFSPLLRPPGDRMTLYGLTAEDVERLERWLEVR